MDLCSIRCSHSTTTSNAVAKLRSREQSILRNRVIAPVSAAGSVFFLLPRAAIKTPRLSSNLPVRPRITLKQTISAHNRQPHNAQDACSGLYTYAPLSSVPGRVQLMSLTDNPFAKREEFTSRNLLAYKILTILSWLLLVVVGAYYTFRKPLDCHGKHLCHTIWGQNKHHPTPFSLDAIVTNVYWIIVLILQAHYVRYLWSADKHYVTSAANVGSHFILVRPPISRCECQL